MPADYVNDYNPVVTPITEPAESRQVPNSTGGYAFGLDCFAQLERFLILGTEGGTYYARQKQITRENAKNVIVALDVDYRRSIELICSIAQDRRAPRQEPAIFALALAASHKNVECRQYALSRLVVVCQHSTALFYFVHNVQKMRGWGPGLRNAIAVWYQGHGWHEGRSLQSLAYQVSKYQSRTLWDKGPKWSHRDVLRLAHVVPHTADHARIYEWITKGTSETLPDYLQAVEACKTADLATTIKLISEFNLPHEVVRTELKNEPDLWVALLPKMPAVALLRNLSKMSKLGILSPFSEHTAATASRIATGMMLHPLQILAAMNAYKQGHGTKGSLTWEVNAQIVGALDAGFYAGFKNITPSAKNIYIALDCSKSMEFESSLIGPGFYARDAAAVMAMATVRSEKNVYVRGFGDQMIDVPLYAEMNLAEVIRTMDSSPAGSTNPALPFIDATDRKLPVDLFAMYTDNEANCGFIHPHQALTRFRDQVNPHARAAAVAFTATNYSVLDDQDPGSLQVAGFDAALPNILALFAAG